MFGHHKHEDLLNEIEAALDRDRDGAEVMLPAKADEYLRKLLFLMEGEIGTREWRLYNGLAVKAKSA